MKAAQLNVLMVDGTQHNGIDLILADQIAYSTIRQRHDWPTMEQDPALYGAYVAYAAMKRKGLFTGTWDEFTNAVATMEETATDVNP